MVFRRRLVWAGLVAAIVASASACGSDSRPVYFRQVLYQLEAQGGGGCVRLDHVASGRARHELPAGHMFVLRDGESRSILLANGPPPYRARFDWVASGCPDVSGRILVSAMEVQGPQAEAQWLDPTTPTATVHLRANAGAVAERRDRRRVRFEICALDGRGEQCADGVSGRVFTGTIGDARLSHILSVLEANDAPTTPATLFLEHARDRVSGQFSGSIGQVLRAELYIDDRLEALQIATRNVVVASDL